MTPKIKPFVPLLALALSPLAGANILPSGGRLPKGWVKAGSVPQSYDLGVEQDADGKTTVILRSIETNTGGFGTLMQVISASAYGGKRLRLTATLKPDGVASWAGLWMRVDGAQGKVLSFDNMEKRPIQGTKPSRRYAVVLDVPRAAQSVSFGVLLNGPGAVQVSDVRVEAVGKDVPLTAGMTANDDLPAKPQNLDFKEWE